MTEIKNDTPTQDLPFDAKNEEYTTLVRQYDAEEWEKHLSTDWHISPTAWRDTQVRTRYKAFAKVFGHEPGPNARRHIIMETYGNLGHSIVSGIGAMVAEPYKEAFAKPEEPQVWDPRDGPMPSPGQQQLKSIATAPLKATGATAKLGYNFIIDPYVQLGKEVASGEAWEKFKHEPSSYGLATALDLVPGILIGKSGARRAITAAAKRGFVPSKVADFIEGGATASLKKGTMWTARSIKHAAGSGASHISGHIAGYAKPVFRMKPGDALDLARIYMDRSTLPDLMGAAALQEGTSLVMPARVVAGAGRKTYYAPRIGKKRSVHRFKQTDPNPASVQRGKKRMLHAQAQGVRKKAKQLASLEPDPRSPFEIRMAKRGLLNKADSIVEFKRLTLDDLDALASDDFTHVVGQLDVPGNKPFHANGMTVGEARHLLETIWGEVGWDRNAVISRPGRKGFRLGAPEIIDKSYRYRKYNLLSDLPGNNLKAPKGLRDFPGAARVMELARKQWPQGKRAAAEGTDVFVEAWNRHLRRKLLTKKGVKSKHIPLAEYERVAKEAYDILQRRVREAKRRVRRGSGLDRRMKAARKQNPDINDLLDGRIYSYDDLVDVAHRAGTTVEDVLNSGGRYLPDEWFEAKVLEELTGENVWTPTEILTKKKLERLARPKHVSRVLDPTQQKALQILREADNARNFMEREAYKASTRWQTENLERAVAARKDYLKQTLSDDVLGRMDLDEVARAHVLGQQEQIVTLEHLRETVQRAAKAQGRKLQPADIDRMAKELQLHLEAAAAERGENITTTAARRINEASLKSGAYAQEVPYDPWRPGPMPDMGNTPLTRAEMRNQIHRLVGDHVTYYGTKINGDEFADAVMDLWDRVAEASGTTTDELVGRYIGGLVEDGDVLRRYKQYAGISYLTKDFKTMIEVMGDARIKPRALIHEFAHFWLRTTDDQTRAVLEEWLHIKNRTWTRGDLERWARAVERYLIDGASTDAQLNSIMERLRRWTLQIYRHFVHFRERLGIEPIPEQVRYQIDRMFGAADTSMPRMPASRARPGIQPSRAFSDFIGEPGGRSGFVPKGFNRPLPADMHPTRGGTPLVRTGAGPDDFRPLPDRPAPSQPPPGHAQTGRPTVRRPPEKKLQPTPRRKVGGQHTGRVRAKNLEAAEARRQQPLRPRVTTPEELARIERSDVHRNLSNRATESLPPTKKAGLKGASAAMGDSRTDVVAVALEAKRRSPLFPRQATGWVVIKNGDVWYRSDDLWPSMKVAQRIYHESPSKKLVSVHGAGTPIVNATANKGQIHAALVKDGLVLHSTDVMDNLPILVVREYAGGDNLLNLQHLPLYARTIKKPKRGPRTGPLPDHPRQLQPRTPGHMQYFRTGAADDPARMDFQATVDRAFVDNVIDEHNIANLPDHYQVTGELIDGRQINQPTRVSEIKNMLASEMSRDLRRARGTFYKDFQRNLPKGKAPHKAVADAKRALLEGTRPPENQALTVAKELTYRDPPPMSALYRNIYNIARRDSYTFNQFFRPLYEAFEMSNVRRKFWYKQIRDMAPTFSKVKLYGDLDVELRSWLKRKDAFLGGQGAAKPPDTFFEFYAMRRKAMNKTVDVTPEFANNFAAEYKKVTDFLFRQRNAARRHLGMDELQHKAFYTPDARVMEDHISKDLYELIHHQKYPDTVKDKFARVAQGTAVDMDDPPPWEVLMDDSSLMEPSAVRSLQKYIGHAANEAEVYPELSRRLRGVDHLTGETINMPSLATNLMDLRRLDKKTMIDAQFSVLMREWVSRQLGIISPTEYKLSMNMSRWGKGMKEWLVRGNGRHLHLPAEVINRIPDHITSKHVRMVSRGMLDLRYAAALGFRLKAPLRNLTQPWLLSAPDMGHRSVWNGLGAAMSDPALEKLAQRLNIYSEFVPELFMEQHLGKHYFKNFINGSMKLFELSDRFNRKVTLGAARDRWVTAAQEFGGVINQKQWQAFAKRARIAILHPEEQAAIRKAVFRNKGILDINQAGVEGFERYAREMIRRSQYAYTKLESPLISQRYGTLGRHFWAFNTWFPNYMDQVGNWLHAGKWAGKQGGKPALDVLDHPLTGYTMSVAPLALASTYILGMSKNDVFKTVAPGGSLPIRNDYHGATVTYLDTPEIRGAANALVAIPHALSLNPKMAVKSLGRSAGAARGFTPGYLAYKDLKSAVKSKNPLHATGFKLKGPQIPGLERKQARQLADTITGN